MHIVKKTIFIFFTLSLIMFKIDVNADLIICKRATSLHKEVCNATFDTSTCQADGYSNGSEIEYGSLGKDGVLTSGDAFDCDVNGDGEYDAITERFYYISDAINGTKIDKNTAVLVYYTNVSGGKPSNSDTYPYIENGNNGNGPLTAIKQLPTTKQWITTLTNTKRQITTETGNTFTDYTELAKNFDYEGYAARLLTVQEVNSGCSITIGNSVQGEISTKCKYLLENTKYSNGDTKTYGEWLENPSSLYGFSWFVFSTNRNVFNNTATNNGAFGVRPVIEVAKDKIEITKKIENNEKDTEETIDNKNEVVNVDNTMLNISKAISVIGIGILVIGILIINKYMFTKNSSTREEHHNGKRL